LWRGSLTEVYFPYVDMPQLRDLQLLVTDGETFFHEERRDMTHTVERIGAHALGYRVMSTHPNHAYRITKEVIATPHLPVVLQRVRFEAGEGARNPLRLFVLAAPHIGGGGYENNAYVVETAGRELLSAERAGSWLVLGADRPFSKLSVGYVGSSDGWTDLAENFALDYEFDRAVAGNVALTGEIPDPASSEFVVALAFGAGLSTATSALLQALGHPFEEHRSRFLEQWDRTAAGLRRLSPATARAAALYELSYALLLSHEDKTFPGAFVASLSIPWGNAHGDEDRGGYHLVWVRDLAKIASGLLASGDRETPLRILIYLASSQQPDGGYPQNFWLNGDAYWRGIQLDEVSWPILLAYRLHRDHALEAFDPYLMVLRAAGYLVTHGPATEQERWEELGGYSPSTLAAQIAALVVAGEFARVRGDDTTSAFLESWADYLESHVESWTVTTEGSLLPAVGRHYIRIHPVAMGDVHPNEDPNEGTVRLPNLPPEGPAEFPAKEVVDAGFLELVRYGIRRPDDRLIRDSLRVVDTLLKVDTPHGPCWRRYNHDGYGQTADGGPFISAGQGRAWPLLTGERGIYEVACGRDGRPYLEAMTRFATATGMLPEQVWDSVDIPAKHLELGGATGSATPLAWAHAEYLTLIRSIEDGRPFDLIEPVARRYQPRARPSRREWWKHNRQVLRASRSGGLRVVAGEPFWLHFSADNWKTAEDRNSVGTAAGVSYLDLELDAAPGPLTFTFFWPESQRWEGVDYKVDLY
jgi:glucoamylase